MLRTSSSSSAKPSEATSLLAPKAPGRLPLRVKIGYALPAMAQFAFQIPVNVLSKKYYADVLLLKLDQLAVGLAAGCVLDGALDLVIGWFADRLRTPYGRRRPLIAIGAVAVAFALWNFLSPPNYASEWMLFVHFTTGFLLYHAAYALFNIPYISLGYELTEDYDERSQIFAGRELLGLLGLFCATALPSAIKMASPATDAVAAEQARNSSGLAQFAAQLFGAQFSDAPAPRLRSSRCTSRASRSAAASSPSSPCSCSRSPRRRRRRGRTRRCSPACCSRCATAPTSCCCRCGCWPTWRCTRRWRCCPSGCSTCCGRPTASASCGSSLCAARRTARRSSRSRSGRTSPSTLARRRSKRRSCRGRARS